MNGIIGGNIVKVKRGSFVNQDTGEMIGYCKFYLLTLGPTDENQTGYDYEGLTCKPEHYNKILELIKSNKPVKVTVDYVKTKDNMFRRVVKKLDDYSL